MDIQALCVQTSLVRARASASAQQIGGELPLGTVDRLAQFLGFTSMFRLGDF